MKRGREAWILVVLLVGFIAATSLFSERSFESQKQSRPSTYSVGTNGYKALYQFWKRRGVATVRHESPLSSLDSTVRLLVLAEPLQRSLSEEELEKLWSWVDEGGSLLLITTVGGTVLDSFPDSTGSITANASPATSPHDVTITAESREFTPAVLRDVNKVTIKGTTTLTNAAPEVQETLIGTNEKAFAITWNYGDGRVYVVADSLAAWNDGIASSDNSVFFNNLATTIVGENEKVAFDEYHQGYGQVEGSGISLWEAIGPTARFAAWFSVVLLLVCLYNANRRFGPVRSLLGVKSRPSTEYISSMAGLYQRAAASAIAIELLYANFIRDLVARLGVPPDVSPVRLAQLAETRFAIPAAGLTSLMESCKAVIDGGELAEDDMLRIAREIQDYRRRAELVRISQ